MKKLFLKLFDRISASAKNLKWSDVVTLFRELKWTKIDTYIMRKFLLSLFGSLVMFVFLYQLTQLFQDIKIMPYGAKWEYLLVHYAMGSLYWAIVLQPFSFLFACVYVLSALARSKELIAMISTGISMYRISFYIVAFTVLYYLFQVLFFNNVIIYPIYQQSMVYRKVVFEQRDLKEMDRLKDNRRFSIYGENNLIYIVGSYSAGTKEMDNITIVQYDLSNTLTKGAQSVISNPESWIMTNLEDQLMRRQLYEVFEGKVSMRIDAAKAVWDSSNRIWLFKNGVIRNVKSGGAEFNVSSFTARSFDYIRTPPYFFEAVWYPMEAMTYQEASQYIDKLKKTRQYSGNAEAQYLQKITYPLGIIFVVLTGIGIINVSSRKIAFVVNFIICMLVFVFYYLFFSMGMALASKGDLHPYLGASLGVIVFAIASSILYTRTRT